MRAVEVEAAGMATVEAVEIVEQITGWGWSNPFCYVPVPAPPITAKPPSCTLSFQYRNVQALGVSVPLAYHGYAHVTIVTDDSTIDYVMEGYGVDGALQAGASGNGLAADNKSTDSSAGKVSGQLSATGSQDLRLRQAK